MQNKNICMELEEVGRDAEQLESFLLMLEQSLINELYEGKAYLPAVSHMTTISREISESIIELKKKYTSQEVNKHE